MTRWSGGSPPRLITTSSVTSARNRCECPSELTSSARPATFAVALEVGAVGGAVDGEARIALKVERLDGAPHAAEPELAVVELDLDAADARRAVPAQCGERLVLVGIEELSSPRGELGRVRLGLVPARLVAGGYAACASSPS